MVAINENKGSLLQEGENNLLRGSPVRFSGSGIWLISRPGFGILKEKGDEIRDCN